MLYSHPLGGTACWEECWSSRTETSGRHRQVSSLWLTPEHVCTPRNSDASTVSRPAAWLALLPPLEGQICKGLGTNVGKTSQFFKQLACLLKQQTDQVTENRHKNKIFDEKNQWVRKAAKKKVFHKTYISRKIGSHLVGFLNSPWCCIQTDMWVGGNYFL